MAGTPEIGSAPPILRPVLQIRLSENATVIERVFGD